MTPGKKKGLDFEASLKKLEEIVKRLEDEEATLEESLKLFAEGKQLARRCETELQQAEERIRQLIEDEEGKIEETPLEREAPDERSAASEGKNEGESEGAGADASPSARVPQPSP